MAKTRSKLFSVFGLALALVVGLSFGGISTAFAVSDSSDTSVPDPVKRGGLVIYKADLETGNSEPQGDASLAGVTYTIRNDSAHSIVYRYGGTGDSDYYPLTVMPGDDASIKIPVKYYAAGTRLVNGETVPAGGAYVAQTRADALPYGTYRVWESDPGNSGYNLIETKTVEVSGDGQHTMTVNYSDPHFKYVKDAKAEQWSDHDSTYASLDSKKHPGYTFSITENQQYVTYKGAQSTAVKTSDANGNSYVGGPTNLNWVKRYGFKVEKYDADLGSSTPQGEASLDGAVFNIYNASAHAVIVRKADGTVNTDYGEDGLVQPGGLVASIRVGDNYFAETVGNLALPYGTYICAEVKAPEGYLLGHGNDTWGDSHSANLEYNPSQADNPFHSGIFATWSKLTGSGFNAAGSQTMGPKDIENGLWLFSHDNPVKRGGVEIYKRDYDFAKYDTESSTPQGDASLNGAKIAIYNDSSRAIYMKDTKETIQPGGLVRVVETKTVTRASGDSTVSIAGVAELYGLPYGKYHAVEVDPSTGYNVTDEGSGEWYYEFEIGDSRLGKCTADGNVIVTSSNVPSKTTVKGQVNKSWNTAANAPISGKANLYEHVIRHGELDDQLEGDYGLNKIDAESGSAVGQGAASMVGTEVTIKNKSAQAIMWKDISRSDTPYKDRTWTKKFAVNADVVTLRLVPIDAQGNVVFAADGKSLNMANPKAHEYKPQYDLEVTADEQLAANIKWYVWRVPVVMGDGSISYEKLTGLPYGTYEVRETKAGRGYMLDTQWRQTIVLHNDKPGKFSTKGMNRSERWMETIHKTGVEGGKIDGISLENKVQRIDVGFTKTGPDGRPLPGVPFKITSKSTGESHIVVTDLNGRIDTRAWQANDDYDETDPWIFMHNRFTNWSDAAYDVGTGNIDPSKLYWQHGHWWFGYADLTYGEFFQKYGFADPQKLCQAINNGDFVLPSGDNGFGYELNNRSALPYDVYEIEELRSDANAGMNLIEPFDFHAIEACHGSNDGFIELATLDNTGYDPSSEAHITTVNADDRVFVQKTSSPAANTKVNGNSDITYTLSYQNMYAGEIADTVVRDYIPKGTTFKSATGSDYKYVEASEGNDAYVEWSLGTLAKGATGNVKLTVTVDKNAASPIIANQARYQSLDEDFAAGSFEGEPWGSTNIVRHSTDGTKTGSSLRAVKVAQPATATNVDRGGQVKYTITVYNDGDTDANSVAVFDYVPTGTKMATAANNDGYQVPVISTGGREANGGVGWQLGTIKAGQSKTVSFMVNVKDDAYGLVHNAATFGTASGIPQAALNNTSNTVWHGVGLSTGLTMTKTADKKSVSAGTVITYTIDLENTGAANIDNLTVTDAIPARTSYVEGSATAGATYADGVVTWNIPRIAHDGGKMQLKLSVKVDDDVKDGVKISNTAVATDGENQWTATDDSSSYDAIKDMDVSKSADPVDGSYVTQGQRIVYTVDWENTGSNPVYGFAVRDVIPEGTHFVDGSIVLVKGDESSADAPVAEHDSTQVRTGQSVDEGTFDEGTASIAGQYSVTLPDPDAVYKFVMAQDWTSEDLSPSPDKGIPAWDTVRSYLYDSSRIPGDWIEFESTNAHSYNYLWRAVVLDSGQIKMSMCVLTPTDTNQVWVDGGRANYDVAGNAVVALIDCVEPGEIGSLSFIVEVDEDAADNFEIVNQATYGAGIENFGDITGDLPGKTNATTHIVGEAKFGVDPDSAVKTASVTHAKRGDVVTYTIAVTNTGTAYAKDVAIVDSLLDNGVKHVMYVPGSFKVEGGDSKIASAPYAQALNRWSETIEAHATKIAPGETMTLSFDVELTDVVDGDVVHNVAAYGDLGETDMNTNVTEIAIQTPQLRIVKSADPDSGDTVLAGDVITYTLTVVNDSDVDATGVAVWDRVPQHTSLVAGSHEGLTEADGALYADGIELAAGAEKTFTFKVKVDGDAETDTIVSNRATTGFAAAPAWPLEIDSNEVVHNVVSFEQKNDINLPAASGSLYATKMAGVATADGVDFSTNVAQPGGKVVYVVNYQNTGVELVDAGIIRDYLPDDLTVSESGVEDTEFASAISEGGVLVPADKSANDRAYVEWTVGTLMPGEVGTAYIVCDVDDEPHSLIANQARYESTDEQLTAGDPANAEPVGRTNVAYLKTDADATAPAAISVFKSAEPASGTTVATGDTVTYKMTVRNGGDVAASGIGVYDVIPAGTELAFADDADGYAQPVISNGGSRIGEDGIGWIISQLAPGEEAEVSFAVTVTDASAFTIENKASFGINVGDVAGPMPGISNIAAHAVEHKAELSIAKTADPAGTEEDHGIVSAGEIVDYTITVTNDGNGNADAIDVYDMVPSGMQMVSGSMWGGDDTVEPTPEDPYMHWSIGSVRHDGGTVEVGFSARVVDDIEVGALIENQASIGERWFDASYEGWSYDLAPKKGHGYVFGDRVLADEAAFNEVLDIVPGTYQVTSDPYVRTTIMINTYDGAFNQTGKRIYTIQPGATANVRIPISGEMYITSVETHDTAAGTLERSVYDKPVVHFEVPDFEDVPAMALSNKTVHEVADGTDGMKTLKSAMPASGSYVAPGDTIYYTVEWENTSDRPVSNFAVRDVVPEHTTLVPGSIVVTGADGKSTSELQDEYDQWLEENSWWLDAQEPEAEPVVWYPGATVGPADAEGVYDAVVVDREHQTFPEWDSVRQWLDTAKPGDFIEFVVENDNFYDFKWIAVIQSDGYVRLFHSIIVPNKEDSPEYREANGVFGNYDSRDNAVYAKAWTVEPGEKGSLTFAVTVDEDAPANYEIVNAYTYDSNVTGLPAGDLSHAGANTTVHIVGAPDVQVADENGNAKTVSPTDPVRPGDELTYTVTLVNKGNAKAKGVAIYDELWQNNVKGVLYVPGSYQVTGGDSAEQMADYAEALTADTRSIAAYASELNPGEELVLTFKVKVEDAVEGDVVTNKATWATDEAGIPAKALATETNEVSTEIIRDTRPSEVIVTKTQDIADGAEVAPGDEITYTVTLENKGGAVATGIGMYDAIPNGTEYVEESLNASGIEAEAGDGYVAALTGRLESGAKATVTYKVKVAQGFYGEIVNHATWDYDNEAMPAKALAKQSNDVDAISPAPEPMVEVTKSQQPADGSLVAAGDEIAYTVTMKNTSQVAINNVAVYDAIPAGTTYVAESVEGSGCEVEAGEGYIAAHADRIEAGQQATVTFKVTVDEGFYGNVTNKATWAADVAEMPSAPLAHETNGTTGVSDAPAAAVEVVKTQDRADGERVTPGDEITYTVTVNNTGKVAVSNIGVFDEVPAGAEYVADSLSCDGIEATEADGKISGIAAKVEPGASASFTFKVVVAPGFAGGVINQASWDYDVASAPTAPLARLTNDVDVISVPPTLSIVKRQDPANGANVAGGDTLTYSITVTNVGPVKAHYVGIYDWAPDGTSYVPGSVTTDKGQVYEGDDGLLTAIVGDLAKGEKATMTFQVVVDFDFVGTIHNRALWVSPAADPASLTTGDVNNAQIHLVDMTSDDVTAVTGNPRTSSPAGAILARPVTMVTVPIPEGSTTGWSNDTGDPDDNGDTPQQGGGDDPQQGGGDDQQQGGNDTPQQGGNDTPQQGGNDTPQQGGNDTPQQGGNDTPQQGGNDTPQQGGNVDDNGNGEGDGTTPAGGNAGSGTDAGDTGEAVGDGSSSLDDVDDKGGSNEVVAHVTKPLVLLTKNASVPDGSYVKAGDEIEFTLVATNIGQNNANKLVVSDVIPTGMTYVEGSVSDNATYENGKVWGTDSLAPGESLIITFKAKVDDGYEGVIENVAKYEQNKDAQPTDDPQGGESNKVTLRAEEPTIELLKSANVADGSYVAPGTEVTYTVKATNKGEAAVSIDVFDSVPEGMTLVEGSVKGAELDKGAIVASKSLEPGASIEFSFKATVDETDEPVDIVNTAAWKVTGSDSDGKPSNEVLVKVGLPGIGIVKTSDPADGSTVGAGEEVAYQIVLSNTGSVLGDISMIDVLPAGMTLVEGSLSEGLSVDDNGDLKWNGTVNAGESVALSYKATVNDDATGELRNTATATVKGIATPAVASDTLLVAPPDFKVAKESDPTSGSNVKAGEEIAYTVTVVNEGLGMGKATLSDTLPEGLEYVEGSVSENAAYADGTVSAELTLGAGETATVTYKAKVVGEVGDEIGNKAVVTPENGEPIDATSTVKVGEAKWELEKEIVTAADDAESDEAAKHEAKPGDTVKYRITVKNTGTIAGSAKLADAVPEVLEIVGDGTEGSDELEGSTGAYKVDGRAISADVELGGGMMYIIEYTTQVKADAEAGDVTNTAKLTAPELAKDLEASATLTVKVDAPEPGPKPDPEPEPTPAKLDVAKTAVSGKTFTKVGESFTFAIAITNSGETATVAHVVDKPGRGLAFKDVKNGKLMVLDKDGSVVTEGTITGQPAKGSSKMGFDDATKVSGASVYGNVGLADNDVVYKVQGSEVFHISKSCAGDGAVETTYKAAKDSGLKPCATCASKATSNITKAKGDYKVVVKDGYTADVKFTATDGSGKVTTLTGVSGANDASVAADSTVTVRVKKDGNAVDDNAVVIVTAEAYSKAATAKAESDNKAAGEYSGSFDIDVPAKSVVTVYVNCDITDAAGDKATNNVEVSYKGGDTVKASADLTNVGKSTPTEKKGSLPETGQTVAVILLVASGIALAAIAGTWLYRRRKDGTRLYR